MALPNLTSLALNVGWQQIAFAVNGAKTPERTHVITRTLIPRIPSPTKPPSFPPTAISGGEEVLPNQPPSGRLAPCPWRGPTGAPPSCFQRREWNARDSRARFQGLECMHEPAHDTEPSAGAAKRGENAAKSCHHSGGRVNEPKTN